jgi:hypothetical protein
MPLTPHLRPAPEPKEQLAPAAPTPLRPPRRHRSKLLILLGLVLSVVCAIGAVSVFRSSASTVAAVAVTTDVRYGETITEAQLRAVDVRPDPALTPVLWDDRAELVGKPVTSDLAAGTLVTADQVRGALPPGAGEQLVGIPVKAAQAPTTPLLPRWPLLLVATDGAQWEPVHATVLRTGQPDSTGTRVVDVTVPDADGPRLAAKAATGDVALVVLPMGAG